MRDLLAPEAHGQPFGIFSLLSSLVSKQNDQNEDVIDS